MTDSQPNIIFIITDQQRYDTVNALGFPYVDTPHMDRLVREGVAFTQCYVASASCASARASLFTGYYPHTTGILKNADTWRHSWVELLNAAGYHCVNVGKMHTWPYDAPAGFHERYVVENKDRYLEGRYYFDEWDKALAARGLAKQQRELYRERDDYRDSLGSFTWDLPEETHSDFFVGNFAKWWLKNKPVQQPFFLQVGFPGPHPPYDPVPRYLEKYADREVPLQEVNEDDLESQPPPFKVMRQHNVDVDHDSVVHDLNPTNEQRLRQRRHYLANVTMIDEKLGELMDALEEQGLLENSVVIFTSDHGDCLTDHGHSQKWTMYDAIVRVPLMVWAPKYFGGNRKFDGLMQAMDMGAAILEMAGVELPESFEAESVLPALRGEAWSGREHVFAEQVKDGIYTDGPFMTMVRGQEWKLVHFLGAEYGQLFNLRDDPGEMHNLWDDPGCVDVKRELHDVLRDWHIHSQVHTAGWAEDWR
ncbi:MAG: sulfatase-like hydrolase/transferase [Verrucomicrobiota bacterium]|nr:sulfatase-like hydrolase/transferase [Verrucomicrobiota bacterium]